MYLWISYNIFIKLRQRLKFSLWKLIYLEEFPFFQKKVVYNLSKVSKKKKKNVKR